MKYSLDIEVINKVLNCLAQFPYAQVHEAMAALQQGASPIEPEAPEDDPEIN